MRMTNLLTQHLGIRLHFLRVDGSGAISRVYENDDLPLPMDVTGAIEGQIVCRRFAARTAFEEQNRTTELYQYTDTPNGTYWCSTQTGRTADGEFSITVGVPFDDARWFRGRETARRGVSTCPDESCCRRPPEDAAKRWTGKAWPSARVHMQMFSPLPSGAFPVSMTPRCTPSSTGTRTAERLRPPGVVLPGRRALRADVAGAGATGRDHRRKART